MDVRLGLAERTEPPGEAPTDVRLGLAERTEPPSEAPMDVRLGLAERTKLRAGADRGKRRSTWHMGGKEPDSYS